MSNWCNWRCDVYVGGGLCIVSERTLTAGRAATTLDVKKPRPFWDDQNDQIGMYWLINGWTPSSKGARNIFQTHVTQHMLVLGEPSHSGPFCPFPAWPETFPESLTPNPPRFDLFVLGFHCLYLDCLCLHSQTMSHLFTCCLVPTSLT